jgi:hypothetical protein
MLSLVGSTGIVNFNDDASAWILCDFSVAFMWIPSLQCLFSHRAPLNIHTKFCDSVMW